ncbi:MAG: hypothetical protein V4772_20895 [Pseudomonadota bacterium]
MKKTADNKTSASTSAASKAAGSASKKRGDSDSFGVEGSNKTLPQPLPDALAGRETDGRSGAHIPKSPHTAGGF